MMRTLMLILITSSLISGQCLASTIHVPSDYPAIQDAISNALDGDTVLVAPGTYYENINLRGKAIHVKGAGGAEATTIDGSAMGSVVTCPSDRWRRVVVHRVPVSATPTA